MEKINSPILYVQHSPIDTTYAICLNILNNSMVSWIDKCFIFTSAKLEKYLYIFNQDEFLKSKYNNLFDTLYGHDLTNENLKIISKKTESMYKEPWFSKDLLENPTTFRNQTIQITNDLNSLTSIYTICLNYNCAE
jgi:hypothetical protein